MITLRPELTVLPERIRQLPISDRGYPVPWFVEWINGQPEFRVMSRDKWILAVRDKRCWVCGGRLGTWLTFVLGPMCGITHTTAEPPCHDECAIWSAINCPFLSRPGMVRREDDFTDSLAAHGAGDAIKRNPGVALLWTTKNYTVFKDDKGAPLISVGEPERVAWYCEGRKATRREVMASIDSGYPLLDAQCDKERTVLDRLDARKALEGMRGKLEALLPA